MTEPPHADEAERLRLALWGGTGPGDSEVDRHVAGCDVCRREVALYRRVRDLLRRTTAAEPPAGILAAMRGRARREAPPPEPRDFEWLTAEPVLAAAGMRAAGPADRQVVLTTGPFRLDVLLHPAGRAGRYAVSGQVLRPDDQPAAGADVALFVDRVETVTTRADAFGEFEFDAHEGSRLGLRVSDGRETVRVELWSAEGGA